MVDMSAIDARILKVLVEHNCFLTTSEISRLAKVAWQTADDYLGKFYGRGWLSKRTVGGWVYWKANL